MIAIGDLHGNFRIINQYGFKEVNIVQVGDFGLGFEKNDEKVMDYWNKSWKARGMHVYTIRGNHDDPKWWDGRYDGRWSNIHLVKDYAVLHLEGKNILCVGGARSIDRADRIVAREGSFSENFWFPGEDFVYDEDQLIFALEGNKIDVVVTHSAPHFCIPLHKGSIVDHFVTRDKDLLLDIQLERELHTRMWEVMKSKGNKPDKWVYGHFHKNNVEYIEGTKFVLVGIGEITNL